MTFHDALRQDEASRIRAQLEALEIERLRLEARLREIESEQEPSPPSSLAATVTNGSPAADKVAFFRKLFAGRTDVFPARWENPKSGRSGYAPACANEWVRGVCGKPQVRCGECPNQSFIPVTDEVIEAHLRGEDRVRHHGRGDFVAGVYPLLFDDTCRFLAVDFDDESWSSDALAFLASCRELGIPAALERSRSGSGGHVWLFFADAVPAFEARRLATMLLTRTMNRRPEIGFKSYDRLFPSQDTMAPLQSQGQDSRDRLLTAFAERICTSILHSVASSTAVSRVLISDYRSSDEFLSLKQKTQCEYGRMLNVFAPIGHHPADSVRRRHIRELSKIFACEAGTQQLFGQVASLLFNFGVGNDYVETNPASRMKCLDRPRA